MKKKLTIALIACLAALTVVFVCGCSGGAEPTEPAPTAWKVTFYESDGETVLTEVEAKDGEPVAMQDGRRMPMRAIRPTR